MDCENDTSWVRGMLFPGEILLWTGKPGKGHMFGKKDVYLIPFSILWCGFAIYWEAGVIMSGAPLIFPLFGIPFVLAGLYITVGRFILKRIRARNSRYALTSQRIIIKVGNVSKSLDLNYLPRMTVIRYADGSGVILFGETRGWSDSGFGFDRSTTTEALAELQNIPDVNGVEYRIRTAVEQALLAKQNLQAE